MSKALDEQCATLLGWHKGVGGAINAGYGYGSSAYWYDETGKQCAPCITDGLMNLHAFSPSTNLAQARLLEDAVEKANLVADYLEALEDVLGIDVYQGEDGSEAITIANEWALVRAAPEARAQAFVKVMG